ncbi:MAG: cation:proton antiporter [Oscillatoriaceae cyanobacterium]
MTPGWYGRDKGITLVSFFAYLSDMEKILTLLPDTPLVPFTILLVVILTVPPIFERIKLPGLVGLLVAGVLLGKHGLQIMTADDEMMKLFAEIGKIYLMFVAGLEIDLTEFQKNKNPSLVFGFATFIIPLITGTLVGRVFGLGCNGSILTGSLFASHTLLAYPIVNRLGVVNNQAVTVTIGATIFTDTAALLVLAICVSIHGGDFSASSLVIQLLALAMYVAAVLWGLDWAGKEYFRRTGDEESNQFLFVLIALLITSVGAQIINVDKIVGAFLAGLAVNDVVGRGPVQEKVEFVGATMFIPFFFVGMGLILDIPAFVQTLFSHFSLTLAVVLGLIGSKFLAALVVKILYGYSRDELFTMWSLSMPQVAATLAAALVGYQVGLLPESFFNTVIVLMIVTSILGPVITARFASRLPIPKAEIASKTAVSLWEEPMVESEGFTVLVPVNNPLTQRYLMEMGAMVARHQNGKIAALTVTPAHVHMDSQELDLALKLRQQLLGRALQISSEQMVEAYPIVRIDNNIAEGISRTAREQNASLIVMGWSETGSLRARLFGSLVDDVFWSSHCPVAVIRLLDAPANIRRILVPVKNLSAPALRAVLFAQMFAAANGGTCTFLHVSDPKTPAPQVQEFESELAKILSESKFKSTSEITTVRDDNPAQIIVNAAPSYDLVILRSTRRRTAGGLAISDVTTECLGKLRSGLILLGEPHS